MKHMLISLSVALMTILLIIFPKIASASIVEALALCANSIIPALFPFLILSNLWTGFSNGRKVSAILSQPTRKLLHLPEEAALPLFLGCISGFPVGAKVAVSLYTEGHLQKRDTEHLLLFCSNAGPAFIFGIIGSTVFESPLIAAILWAIHIFSAFMIGILFRPKILPAQRNVVTDQKPQRSFSTAFVNAVTDAGKTVFQICLFIAAFSVIIGFLSAALPTILSSSPLYPLLVGFLELSKGIHLLSVLPKSRAFIYSAVLLAWNGLCVHFQVLSFTSHASLSLKRYFVGKFLHVILSLTFALIFTTLL